MEAAKAFFRPILSPKWPNKIAPNGRIKKPTANTPKVANRDKDLSALGKNRGAIIGAKYPYNAKSYISSILPQVAGNIIFLFEMLVLFVSVDIIVSLF